MLQRGFKTYVKLHLKTYSLLSSIANYFRRDTVNLAHLVLLYNKIWVPTIIKLERNKKIKVFTLFKWLLLDRLIDTVFLAQD